jgi:hypothetical protein
MRLRKGPCGSPESSWPSALTCNQRQSVSIRGNQCQSKAIRGSPESSWPSALTCNQRQSEAISVNQRLAGEQRQQLAK